MPQGLAEKILSASSPTGIVGPVRRVPTRHWTPPGFKMYAASAGFVSSSQTLAVPYALGAAHGKRFTGTGRSIGDEKQARFVAVAEALERYSTGVWDDNSFILARGDALGTRALDMDHLPACSRREYADPGCPLAPPDPAAAIRWSRGVNLMTGQETLVPAVMTYALTVRLQTEAFWMPISTGCAIHSDPLTATFNAICEVIERDALALTWLQRLALPQLAAECIPDAAAPLLTWAADQQIRTYLFDATTDVGIPTVYCLQVAPEAPRGAQLVGCATDLDVRQAAIKALLEVTGIRAVIAQKGAAPRRYRDYRTVTDGACYMGMPSRRRAFGFLLDGADGRPRSHPRLAAPETPRGQLDFVLERLATLGMTPYLVDITPADVRDLGLTCHRVIIPGLQPMSLHPLARFTAHDRLYAAPRRMGFPAHGEKELNRWPQPMA
jgi:ribosomal protein S12 methylthiotransferase accessory factor